MGGALLDEFGNYVGVIGGSIVPSANPFHILALLNEAGPSSTVMDWETTGLAVPQSLLPDLPSMAALTSFAELASRGEFAPLVIKSNSIRYMSVSSGSTKTQAPCHSHGIRNKLSRSATVRPLSTLNWQRSAKRKFPCTLKLFTTDNKMISASKTQEISLGPDRYASTNWDLPVGLMPPGIYRVDLVINDTTAWREFIRVRE